MQNLRDFTVQIRHFISGEIVGTGFLCSHEGLIVTCGHVVRDAGVDGQIGDISKKITIVFPQALFIKGKYFAYPAKYCHPYKDDIVLLQLLQLPVELTKLPLPRFGDAADSKNHPFEVFGYTPTGKFHANPGTGIIQGLTEVPEGETWLCEPVALTSSQIDKGMSGAAILDTKRDLVVGITLSVWYPDANGKKRDNAYGANARVLSLPPLSNQFQTPSITSNPLAPVISLLNDGKYQQAISFLEPFLTPEKHSIDAYYYSALAYSRSGHYLKAVVQLRLLLSEHPSHMEAQNLLHKLLKIIR